MAVNENLDVLTSNKRHGEHPLLRILTSERTLTPQAVTRFFATQGQCPVALVAGAPDSFLAWLDVVLKLEQSARSSSGAYVRHASKGKPSVAAKSWATLRASSHRVSAAWLS